LEVDTLIGPFYRDDVVTEKNETGAITKIITSRFMCYSIGLNTTADCVGSMLAGRTLTDNSGIDSFFYSVYMIYFEEYFMLKGETLQNLGLALAGVFIVNMVCVGMSVVSSVLVVVVIAAAVAETFGYSAFWNIAFNPLSAVNLIMGVGLCVEFVSHFVRAFLKAEGKTADERVALCLKDMGPNVISGFSATFLCVLVLAGAQYQVITDFYFHMYILILLLGFANGFILLPVLLSLINPAPFTSGSTEEERLRDRQREWGEVEDLDAGRIPSPDIEKETKVDHMEKGAGDEIPSVGEQPSTPLNYEELDA